MSKMGFGEIYLTRPPGLASARPAFDLRDKVTTGYQTGVIELARLATTAPQAFVILALV